MELELTKNELKDFINVFKTINKTIDEIQIKLNEEGLSIIQLDNANVCLFDIKISKDFFLSYGIDKETTIRFNTKEFLNAIKNFKDYLNITIEDFNLILKDNKQIYNIDLIGVIENTTKKPELEFKFNIEFESLKDFFKTLKVYKNFSDYVTIETNKNLLLTQNKNKYLLKELNNNTLKVNTKYSLDYLLSISYFKDLKAKINLSTDYPLLIEFFNNNKSLYVGFILAPRVDTD